jgi:hypothetical protein
MEKCAIQCWISEVYEGCPEGFPKGSRFASVGCRVFKWASNRIRVDVELETRAPDVEKFGVSTWLLP